LIPVVDEATSSEASAYSLASWITLTSGPVTVAPGESGEIPFTVTVPTNAEPGGHYAAVLVGTQPNANAESGTHVSVSSYVSSLLFVTIKGDVIEKGRIREFSTTQSLYQSPQASFVLRFENTGNTHVKPEGNITIYNMWGKQRGQLAINQNSGNFGNVLPQSVRRFEFSWSGDNNPFDIGLYSAVVTLSYGQTEKQNVSATAYFWVVPIVPVSIAIGIILLIIILAAWFIRRYVRHALSLEKQRIGIVEDLYSAPTEEKAPESPSAILMQPIREGVIDLRALAGAPVESTEGQVSTAVPAPAAHSRMTLAVFARKYRLFLAFLAVIAALSLGGYLYFKIVLIPERGFEIKDVQIHEESPQPVHNDPQTP
jgi:hypothetical protein